MHMKADAACRYDAVTMPVSPNETVSAQIARPGLTTAQIVSLILEGYADRPALADRDYELVCDAGTGARSIRFLPAFRTLSYGKLAARIQAVRNVWQDNGPCRAAPGSLIAILGFTSVDYVTVDMACVLGGVTSVPLQANMNSAALAAILREVEPACFFTSIENAGKALSALELSQCRSSLVVMDYEPKDDAQGVIYAEAQQSAVRQSLSILTLQELLDKGALLPAAAPFVPASGQNHLATIFYTSGSTGMPKGAMYPDSLFRRWWSVPGTGMPVVGIAYQPLNHGLGRMTVIKALNQGGICCFVARSDMSTLFEDVRLVRPTSFAFVPRVAELVYDHYRGDVARRVAQGMDDTRARRDAMEEMRATFLGGRVQTASTATAPLTPEISDFISECFDVTLDDNYGSTEAGGISVNGAIIRPLVTDYKLIDVPELGYFTSDRPYPRGELLVKTDWMIPGYYKQPELTAKLFDVDGYLVTGDIVEEHAPDRIAYLDRRNNVFKLAQGEFVAVAQLEALLVSGHPLIRQAYLHGDSLRAFLVAVLVPDIAAVREQLGHEPDPAELKAVLREAVKEVASASTLRAYEVPRDFIVETEPFSIENGLLSDVGKHLRPKLKARYAKRLDALYATIADRQEQELEALRAGGDGRSVLERVKRALEAVLGLVDIDETCQQNFAELGGDSLAAVSLLSLLEEIFGVSVPVAVILDPTGTPGRLAAYIEAIMAEATPARGFLEIHGSKPVSIQAADLALSRLIDPVCLDNARCLPTSYEPARCVLVTGANGFLGRFVCLEWLERLAGDGGKVVCIIRAPDDVAALKRVEAVYDRGDPQLLRRFKALANDHLEVLAGDLAAPGLGLPARIFERLAAEVDLIVHVGALVNHVLGYRALFEPNVLGTAELIKLACVGRRKRIDYVSTIAVCFLRDGEPLGEDLDVRGALPACDLGRGYANGYAVSKWAGEILLRNAHESLGIGVNIFRADMILAHTHYLGQINPTDIFTRLLVSVVRTGIAPQSFYEAPERTKSHAYDGLPVDFIAGAMVGISVKAKSGFATYNISNLANADASLDEIVDWVGETGHPVQRIADYGHWFRQFEQRLRAMPEKQRSQSSFPILNQLKSPAGASGKVASDRFHAAVTEAGGRPAASARITPAFIAKCVTDLEVLALAHAPGAL